MPPKRSKKGIKKKFTDKEKEEFKEEFEEGVEEGKEEQEEKEGEKTKQEINMIAAVGKARAQIAAKEQLKQQAAAKQGKINAELKAAKLKQERIEKQLKKAREAADAIEKQLEESKQGVKRKKEQDDRVAKFPRIKPEEEKVESKKRKGEALESVAKIQALEEEEEKVETKKRKGEPIAGAAKIQAVGEEEEQPEMEEEQKISGVARVGMTGDEPEPKRARETPFVPADAKVPPPAPEHTFQVPQEAAERIFRERANLPGDAAHEQPSAPREAPPADPGQAAPQPKDKAPQERDAVHMEDVSGRPVDPVTGSAAEGDVGEKPDPSADTEGVALSTVQAEGDPEVEPLGDFGADGRDDFLSPDELKTLHQDEFTWRQDDEQYLSLKSRGKLGYGTRADVQRIEPFGIAVTHHPDQDDDILIKQREGGFEPFRGPHVLERVSAEQKQKGMEQGPGQDIEPVAGKPFAKIDGRIIWIPFYGETAKYFFKASDYEELVSNVMEDGGVLKLKAPDMKVFKNMQETVDQVRDSLRTFGLMQKRLRHESLTTRHAEWLELRQIMKAIADYQETTTGEYNTAGLFSGNLRYAVTKALDDTVSKMDMKTVARMKRCLEGEQRGVQARAEATREAGELPSMNPFMVEDPSLRTVHETLPRFF